jgi:hypothetical protein
VQVFFKVGKAAVTEDRLDDVRDAHVLVDAEVLFSEARHESAALVGHRRGDVDQFDAGLEAKRLACWAACSSRSRRS